MDFFQKNLEETLEALNKLIERNIKKVNTKRVRRCNNVKSSNRSKINFIWRALKYLEGEGILEPNGTGNPKTYKINRTEKINVKEFVSKVDKNNKEKRKKRF